MELGFVGELWGLDREPDPAPAGYGVPPFCPPAVVALQLPEAVRDSSGVYGVHRNRELLYMCLTTCKGKLQTLPWLASPQAKASAVLTFYCS